MHKIGAPRYRGAVDRSLRLRYQLELTAALAMVSVVLLSSLSAWRQLVSHRRWEAVSGGWPTFGWANTAAAVPYKEGTIPVGPTC